MSEHKEPSSKKAPRRMVRRRGVESKQRTRSLGWLILLAVVTLVLTVGFAGARSYQDLRMARARVAQLEDEISRARVDVARLRERAEQLEGNPAAIRRAIRSELGLVEPGELILVLPPDETP